MPYRERANADPVTAAHPGFYRVPAGMLIESGDQRLDRLGHPQPLGLDQVGRRVPPELVVLRVERRHGGH